MILLYLIILFVLLLTRSALAVQYASEGLLLWFNHMIPALFPCIVWSNIMIRTDSTGMITRWIYPFLHRSLGLSKHGSFVLLIGFTGGFPLGAKLTSDLLKEEKISYREAEFLLSFCNNLGPVYLLGFLFPLLNISQGMLCLAILYGIPIFYGLVQYTFLYRGVPFEKTSLPAAQKKQPKTAFSYALDTSLQNAVHSIVILGAYVIFFQTLRLFYYFLPDKLHLAAALLTEINSGISQLSAASITENEQILTFCCVTLGGLCCIAQTDHVLHGSGLSSGKYILHKIIQTFLVFCVFVFFLKVLHISL